MANIDVNPGPDLRLSRDEYRQWTEQQPDGRFERIDGVVVAMAPERASHADRKALVWLTLRQAVAAAGLPCHVYPDGMTVEVDDNDFEPDAVLHCGEPLPGDAIAEANPMVVVEVLSPSTRGDDLTRKLVAYFRLPSVQHYLVVGPTGRRYYTIGARMMVRVSKPASRQAVRSGWIHAELLSRLKICTPTNPSALIVGYCVANTPN